MMPVPLPHDIVMPPAAPWWPPAPGWWLLALAVLGFGGWLLRAGLRRQRRRRWRQHLLAEFERRVAAAGLSEPERLAAALVLIRRLVRRSAPRLAASSGSEWLRFLDGDDPDRPFSTGVGRAVLDAPYRSDLAADTGAALIDLLRRRLHQLLAEAARDA